MWGLSSPGETGWRRRFFRMGERAICALSTHIAPDGRGVMEFAVQEGLCRRRETEVVGNGSSNGIDLRRFDPSGLRPQRSSLRREFGGPGGAVAIGTVARSEEGRGGEE